MALDFKETVLTIKAFRALSTFSYRKEPHLVYDVESLEVVHDLPVLVHDQIPRPHGPVHHILADPLQPHLQNITETLSHRHA